MKIGCNFNQTSVIRGENDMEKKSIHEIISTILKAVTLAMGVAVVVLSRLGSLDVNTAVALIILTRTE